MFVDLMYNVTLLQVESSRNDWITEYIPSEYIVKGNHDSQQWDIE